jgi:hypothetical protein
MCLSCCGGYANVPTLLNDHSHNITSTFVGNWSGQVLLDLLQPTMLWVAINTMGYVSLGVGTAYVPQMNVATTFNILLQSATSIPAPKLLTVQSSNSDWQSTVQWEPLTGLCRNYSPELEDGYIGFGTALTFAYSAPAAQVPNATTLTPSMCGGISNPTLAIGHSTSSIYNSLDDAVWISFLSSTLAAISYTAPIGFKYAIETIMCDWDAPLGNNSYVSVATVDGTTR